MINPIINLCFFWQFCLFSHDSIDDSEDFVAGIPRLQLLPLRGACSLAMKAIAVTFRMAHKAISDTHRNVPDAAPPNRSAIAFILGGSNENLSTLIIVCFFHLSTVAACISSPFSGQRKNESEMKPQR
jgi:uncharacterized protein involved in cysteine biosynthesis